MKIIVQLPEGLSETVIYEEILYDVVAHWLNQQLRFEDLKAYQDGDDSFEDEAKEAGMLIQIER